MRESVILSYLADISPTYPIFPDDFEGVVDAPFLKISIVRTPTERIGYNDSNKWVKGLLKFFIYIKSGKQLYLADDIAAELDTFFQDKTIDAKVTFDQSTTQKLGRDPDDKTLTMYEYSIPFTYYGV